MGNEIKDKEPLCSDEHKSKEILKKSNWFGESILIFIVPLMGYIYAIAHELGYCSYFSIPSSLIFISIPNLATSTLTILIFVCIFIILAKSIWKYSEKDKSLVKLILFAFIPFAFMIAACMLIIVFLPKYAFYLFAFLIVLTYIKFYPFFNFDTLDFLKTLHSKSISPHETLKNVITIMLMFSAFVVYIYFIGSFSAKNQRDYYILKGSPEKVVLRIYNENIVCVPFDRTSKTISYNFSIKKITDNSVSLKQEKVGPLKPSE